MFELVYDGDHRNKYGFGRGALARALRKRFDGRDCFAVARQLAMELHETSKVAGPPFKPADFAEHLGITWEMRNDIEAEGVLTDTVALHSYALHTRKEVIEGALVTRPGLGTRILLRRIEGSGPCADHRLNFTFAHEIGHYVLRREAGNGRFRVDDPEEETLCNVFAEELLMPSNRVQKELASRVCPGDLIYLQARYAVSLQALLTRVASFFGGDLVGVIWKKEVLQPLKVTWATTKRFRKMILCDTEVTPVERAFGATDVQNGSCKILLNGSLSQWDVTAMRLSGSGSSKVLSIFTKPEPSS